MPILAKNKSNQKTKQEKEEKKIVLPSFSEFTSNSSISSNLNCYQIRFTGEIFQSYEFFY